MDAPFLKELSREVLVCDGAMGTELTARGLEPGASGELLNVEAPETVAAVHRAYLEAGARVILTNTFGGSRWALARHGLAERAEELNAAAAALARREAARFPGAFVLGDIGPTGELPEPLGTRRIEEFHDVFAEQARALAAVGPDGRPRVDGLIVETMTLAEECASAVRAAREATGLPVIGSMAFDYNPGREGFFTPMGVGVEAMVEHLVAAGADLLGANCGTIDIRQMAGLVEDLHRRSGMPILAEANAGTPRLEGGRVRYTETPAGFAAGGPALVRAGARIIGGCCGTSPAHIAALAKALRGP